MKVSTLALLALINVVVGKWSKKTPKDGEAGWDECAVTLRCQNDWECAQTWSCFDMALFHDPTNYCACGYTMNPYQCWCWTPRNGK
ncbi:hypothetical protein BDBG_03177 [Blastomyces gilchristii SLH14081]|uniref:Uncharacterized protein n=1 Tax=Blastomyces gilchristii (strain SLH14081) TaxID=559298 RepID=A0A179UKZ5_BLAGS|nr:uncharacterized protein BDBG_03177 [Blastomyces gilchristii SLH14081]OAT07072.1 hypothetical protein BDBG_03177 [Blastomyces gilchristii SLH14081]